VRAIIIAAIAVVLLGGTAAVAAPIIYRDLVAEPAADTPALSADDSVLDAAGGEALDPESLAGEWLVSDGSYAGYRVDEVLNGTDVTVTGRTEEVSGSLTLDGLTLTAAEFTVDVASIATDSSQRDSYFRDTAMNVSEHPDATFVLTSPVTIAESPNSGDVVEQSLTGDLTIAGVTRPVTFTVELRSDGTTTEIAGQIPITFADFDIDAPNLGFVSVEPEGYVEFALVATKS
jgi:polyisoprenoid-binding protein YceI